MRKALLHGRLALGACAGLLRDQARRRKDPMTLHLVSNTGRPPRRSRRGTAKDPLTLRAIDCRPDLYERLRESWPSGRWRWKLLVPVTALAAILVIAVCLYS